MSTLEPRFADRIELQNRLFGELSRMFGAEVPLYDRSLLVNRECNRAVCDLLARLHVGFTIDDAQLERAGGERHGAIRIGTAEEYRWVTRLFGVFAMEPHNFYDMTDVGPKSQPVIATAFRSALDPEHRVFCSLLMTDWFDDETRRRIEARLERRSVFTDAAKALVDRAERDGGLTAADADALIAECTGRIFRWLGVASDHTLFTDLCSAGFKIAADIACFRSHHLNHLTPNTLWIDLYAAAMRMCMGSMEAAMFERRAATVLGRLVRAADADWLRLHFRHLNADRIDAFGAGEVDASWIDARAATLACRLLEPDCDLRRLPHAGFKDLTEGPPQDTPILLRQDAYKALTEPVSFEEDDGSVVESTHTARFGEIEQRFWATTPKGRALYDECLARAEADRAVNSALSSHDMEAHEALCAAHFRAFPKTLPELLAAGLVHGRYSATADGLAAAAAGTISTADLRTLVEQGHVRAEGVRYEDFLPVSAAGIFASNLNQYGTRSTATVRPTYTKAMLERIMGRSIVEAATVYAGIEAQSILATLEALGVLERLDGAERTRLEACVGAADVATLAGTGTEVG